MNTHDDEKLIDALVGEAVLAMLAANAALNNASLIKYLRTIAAAEKDATRRRACERAIREVVSARRPAGNRSDNNPQQIRDSDNVVHLFTNDGPLKGSQKH